MNNVNSAFEAQLVGFKYYIKVQTMLEHMYQLYLNMLLAVSNLAEGNITSHQVITHDVNIKHDLQKSMQLY